MKVWFCAEPIVTGAAKLIKETGEFHTASNIFLYGKDNFQTETTGSARIAFQACSEANHGQIYLKDVSIASTARRTSVCRHSPARSS